MFLNNGFLETHDVPKTEMITSNRFTVLSLFLDNGFLETRDIPKAEKLNSYEFMGLPLILDNGCLLESGKVVGFYLLMRIYAS